MPQSFTIGNLSFNFYGLFLAFGLLASYLYSSKKRNLFGLTQKTIDFAYLLGIFGAVIGARLYHVLKTTSCLFLKFGMGDWEYLGHWLAVF